MKTITLYSSWEIAPASQILLQLLYYNCSYRGVYIREIYTPRRGLDQNKISCASFPKKNCMRLYNC